MPRTKIRRFVVSMVILGASPAMADPLLDVFPEDLVDIPIGSTRIMHTEFDNFGDAPVTITRFEITGADAAHFAFASPAAPACNGGQICEDSFSLDAGSFTLLDIACTPDQPRQFTATLIVTSNAANGPISATLSCDIAGPHLTFTPATLAFPTTAIGYFSAPQVVQLHNTGGTTLAFRKRFGSPGDFATSLDRICDNDDCFLPPGATMPISIRLSPASSGPIMRQLVLETREGTAAMSLTGAGVGPQISFEQPAMFQPLNLGTTLLGTTTAPGTIRIRNIGNTALHVTAAMLVGGSEVVAFSVTGPPVPFDVAPNATATWQVTCHPVRFGSNQATLVIENNAALEEFPVLLQCIGNGGVLALDPIAQPIPATPVGSSSTIPMVLRNTGDRPVAITAVQAADPQFIAAPHTGGLPITLLPGAATSFDLTFTPVRGGEQSSDIQFTNDGVVPVRGFARGVGHTGRVELTPAEPGFGPVRLGTTSRLLVNLTSLSDQTFTLTSITVGDPTQFEVSDPTPIGSVLQPDQSLFFEIRATPAALGAQDTDLTFAFDHGPPTIVHTTVAGVAPVLAVETWDGRPSDGTAEFGVVQVGSSAAGLLSVTNTGTATLRIASCSIVGDAAFSAPPACAFELAPAESADLMVTFAPATTGPHSAILRFTSDASTTMLDVALSGAATPSMGCAAGRDAGSGLAILLVGVLAARRRSRHARRAVTARGNGRTTRVLGVVLVIAGCGTNGDDVAQRTPGRGSVTVTRVGTGSGEVRSLDHEVDCGARCSASFADALHLAAHAAPGSIFAGWEGPCVGTGPCVITPSASPAEVIARFEHQFRLTVAGDAPVAPFAGEVTVNGERCAFPCVRDLLEGTAVTLDVFTLSTFTGWSGGCTPTAAPCTLVIHGNVDLTAHFATPDEQWTATSDGFLPAEVTLVGDDPVVAGVDGNDAVIARYISAGTRTWLTRIPGGDLPQIVGLDHNQRGQVYVLVASLAQVSLRLQKLDVNGEPLWSATFEHTGSVINANDDPSLFLPGPLANDGLAVAPNDDVMIVAGSAFVRAYADDGSIHWTRTIPASPAFPLDVSVDANGITTVACDFPFSRGLIDRYGPDGAHLAQHSLPQLSDEDSLGFSYQAFAVAGDQLIYDSTDGQGGQFMLNAVDAASFAPAWQIDASPAGTIGPTALAVDGRGDVLLLDNGSVVRKLVGRTIAWRRGPHHAFSPGGFLDAPRTRDVGGDSQGRVIEVGRWVRGCGAGEDCSPDGTRVTGFVRSGAP